MDGTYKEMDHFMDLLSNTNNNRVFMSYFLKLSKTVFIIHKPFPPSRKRNNCNGVYARDK